MREARRLMPEVGIQIPPNLADWWPRLVAAGATDLGGLSANGDHISPEHPFPSPNQVRKRLAQDGYALTERLCVYPRFIDPEWIAQGVLDVIKARFWSFIPRRGSGRIDGPKGALRPDTIARAPRRRRARRGRGDRAVRRDAARGDRGHAPGGRRAARRARRRHRHVRRQPQHQRLERLRRRLRVLRLRAGPALAGRLHARARGVRRARSRDAVAYGATELCIQSGIHPDWTLEDYEGWLRLAKDEAPELTCTPTRRWRSTHMATAPAPPREVFARLTDAGLGSVPGTAAEVLDDGVRQRISPNKLPVARWVEIVEAAHTRRPALHRDRDVRPHRGAARAGRAHARRARRCRSAPAASRSSCRSRSSRSTRCWAARTGSRRSRATENLKHTAAFRLALGRTIPSLQASWVKMGLDAATEALRWGVNDLGGTLMEETISRLAGSYHGVKLDPADLVAAAHRAGRPAAERTTLYGIAPPLPAGGGRRVTTALALGRRLAAGELDAECAVRGGARAGARRRPAVFTRLTEERARREAAASAGRHRAGTPRGPLDGVPVAWKDLLDVAGTPTTAASALRRDAPPPPPTRRSWRGSPPPGWSASARRT